MGAFAKKVAGLAALGLWPIVAWAQTSVTAQTNPPSGTILVGVVAAPGTTFPFACSEITVTATVAGGLPRNGRAIPDLDSPRSRCIHTVVVPLGTSVTITAYHAGFASKPATAGSVANFQAPPGGDAVNWANPVSLPASTEAGPGGTVIRILELDAQP